MQQIRRRILLNLIRMTDLAVMTIAFGIAFVVAVQSVQAGSLGEYLAVRIKLVNFLFFVGWLVTWHLILKSFKYPRRLLVKHSKQFLDLLVCLIDMGMLRFNMVVMLFILIRVLLVCMCSIQKPWNIDHL